MKKYIVPVITGIVTFVFGVVVGVKMSVYVYEPDFDSNSNSDNRKVTKPIKSESHSKPVVKKINKTQSNETWNVTLDSVTTERVKKSDDLHFTAVNDYDIKKLLPEEFYMTTVEATIENKLDKDIDGSRSTGEYILIDGNGYARTISGTTLSSYTDVRPMPIESFPPKSKTKIQFIVLSEKNDFNSDNIKISLPDFAKDEDFDDVYPGGTFDFQN